MTALTVSLSADLHEFVEAQVVEGRYPSAEAYVSGLIRAERRRRAKERVETLLLEALESPASEMTKADWDGLRQRLRERYGSEESA